MSRPDADFTVNYLGQVFPASKTPLQALESRFSPWPGFVRVIERSDDEIVIRNGYNQTHVLSVDDRGGCFYDGKKYG